MRVTPRSVTVELASLFSSNKISSSLLSFLPDDIVHSKLKIANHVLPFIVAFKMFASLMVVLFALLGIFSLERK